jgi:hypothetical protein
MKRVAIHHRVAIALAAALFACAGASGQSIIYVDVDAIGANDGTSWTNAFTSLQPALDAAMPLTPPIQIWVAAGTYLPSLESDPGDPRSRTFGLIQGVSLYGGFAGTEGSIDERDIAANPTVLDGDFNGDDLPGFVNRSDNAYHVVTSVDLTEATVLDGFTIRGGQANFEGQPEGLGGGIYVPTGRLLVARCAIIDCFALEGGGIFTQLGLRVEQTSFTSCHASTGGAVACFTGSSSSFLSCRAEMNEAIYAGAFYVWDATIENCVFVSNCAGCFGGLAQGGAVIAEHASRLLNCVFASNMAVSDTNAAGGAVFVQTSTPGLSFSAHGCTFYGNSAVGPVERGGAIASLGSFGSVEIDNSIMWQNSAADGDQAFAIPGGTALVFRTCCIDGSAAGVSGPAQLVDVIDIDPAFVDAPAGDFRLQSGSPLIDRGHNDFAGLDTSDLDQDLDTLEVIPIDVAGRPRRMDVAAIADAGDPGAPGCDVVDIGAHETPDAGGTGTEFCWAQSGAGNFHLGTSWVEGAAPGAADVAVFESGNPVLMFFMDAVTSGLRIRHGVVVLDLDADFVAHTYECGALRVGQSPVASTGLTLSGAGTLEATDAVVGDTTNSSNVVFVQSGARLEVTSELRIGVGGEDPGPLPLGSVEITVGGNVACGQATIGDDVSGSSGGVIVWGTGSLLEAQDAIALRNGSLRVEGTAIVRAGTVLLIEGGSVAGDGTIEASVVNSGFVEPGALVILDPTTSLVVDGDYTQQGGGSMRIEIGGPGAGTGHDRLQITGNATLAGGLIVETIGGFEPALLDSFPILTATSVNGVFDIAVLPAMAAEAIMRVQYASGAATGVGAVMVTVDPLGEVIEIAPPDSIDLPGDPAALVLADLDGGSGADIAVALRGATPSDPGSVVIFLNDGTGSFTEFVAANPIGLEPADIDAGLIDGDTNVDLAVANSADDTVSVLFGNGDGTFDAAVLLPGVVPAPLGVAIADWSGDGLDDLAVTSSTQNEVHFFRSQRGGAVVFEGAVAVGARPGLIDPGDLDDDKNLDDVDFIVVNQDNGTISLLISRLAESGQFDFDEEVHSVGDEPAGLAVRDLDLDGTGDVVTANEGDGTISILLADGAGSLRPATSVTIGEDEAPASVASGDLDLDGDFDLAVITRAGDATAQIHLLRNDLDAGAQLAFTLDPVPPIDAPQAIRVASRDVNPATEDDIVTIHGGGGGAGPAGGPLGSLSLFVSTTLPTCPGDVDESGAVTFGDLLSVLASWGPCAACPEDVDNNGTVGFSDLLAVLAAWGPCT